MVKPYRAFNWVAENHRARFDIECPFCRTVVTAYRWSIAAHGRRCPACKAMHHYDGTTSRDKAKCFYCKKVLDPEGEALTVQCHIGGWVGEKGAICPECRDAIARGDHDD